ncbi:MAG: NAD(P)H-dependent glycerol-3-phosphate dehydrogenase, partial [Rhodospirillaceae bacterium]
LERGTGALMHEVLAEVLPGRPWGVLTGPTFAAEVARGQPTAVTLAAEDPALALGMAKAVGTRSFRPYPSEDPVGSQVGGAVKNVMAIACGIVEGRGMGDNAGAALLTRGLAEIGRLAARLGGRAETVAGLSGLGDLALTASSMQSRNFSLGVALGQGQSVAEILAGRKSVAEGVQSAPAVLERAAKVGADMPITQAVADILSGSLAVDAAIEGLLSRPFRPE